MAKKLKRIAGRYKGKNVDMTLVRFGGTTIPSPGNPLLIVTTDGSNLNQFMVNVSKEAISFTIPYRR